MFSIPDHLPTFCSELIYKETDSQQCSLKVDSAVDVTVMLKRAEQKKSYQAEQPDTGACRQPDKRGKPWTQCYQQNKNNRSCWHTGGETHRASVRRRKRSIWWTYVGAMFTLLTTSPCRDDGERESRRTVSYQLRNVCNLCECVWMLRVELCAKTAVSKATFQLSCCNNSSGPDGHHDSPRLWLSVK